MFAPSRTIHKEQLLESSIIAPYLRVLSPLTFCITKYHRKYTRFRPRPKLSRSSLYLFNAADFVPPSTRSIKHIGLSISRIIAWKWFSSLIFTLAMKHELPRRFSLAICLSRAPLLSFHVHQSPDNSVSFAFEFDRFFFHRREIHVFCTAFASLSSGAGVSLEQ